MFNKILSFLGLRPGQVDDTQIRENWRYLAKVCRTRRMQKGISVNELAKRAGVIWGTLNNFELLRAKTRAGTIRKIFNALGLDLNKVISEIQNEHKRRSN
jgi:transcriptional regulator with XRE-family HTH domain